MGDEREWIEAGLYDPAAPTAGERLELLRFLDAQGCALDEMVTAHTRGRLFALAGDRIIRPGRDQFDLDEVAAQLDRPVEQVRRLWRAYGLVDVGGKVASPADVQVLRTTFALVDAIGLDAAVGLSRVIGSSLARIGDATSAAFRSRFPNMSVSSSGSELTTAQAFAATAAVTPEFGRAVDVLLRHHLEAARMHFERTDSDDVVGEGGIRLAVGFADLCGFTGMTQRLRMDELSRLMSAFEGVASDVVSDHDGRIVKFLGDAVMFVTPDPVSAVAAADDLVTAAEQRGLQARAGVSSGTVLAMDGDYFGPVVNLAARLVGVAEPGDVLASFDVVERIGDRRAVTSLGPQQIRGFAELVEIYRLARAG